MFGVGLTTWKRWQRSGRVPLGQWARVPGMRPWCKVFDLVELHRLLDEFSRLGQPYADAERPGCWRVPVMSFSTTRCEAIVDAESVPLVQGRWWNWVQRGSGCGPVVICYPAEGGSEMMRNLVMGRNTSQWRIIHANGDRLDCRRANLIVRDTSEHAASAQKHKTYGRRPCTSRFKGVTWEQTREKWRVMIARDGQWRFIGRFGDEIAAAEAYDEAARELFGEHARLNFPDGIDGGLARAA